MSGNKMLRFCKDAYCNFRFDWIVLTACLVGLAIVGLASIHAGDVSPVATSSDFFTPSIHS